MAKITDEQRKIGERFKDYVAACGGGKALSELTGLSGPLISRHITGDTKELSSSSMRKLIRKGNLNCYWYYMGWGEMFRKPVDDPQEFIMDSRHMDTIESVITILSNIPEDIKSHSKLNKDRIVPPVG